MFKFEDLKLLLKSLFQKSASVVTTYNTPILPVCCVMQFRKFYIRAVFLDTKLVVLGLPKAYRRNTSVYYVNYGYKNYEAIVNTPETNNRLHAICLCFPSKINERKKHWCWTINIYTAHKIEREFYYRIFKADFFRLNVELNTK